MSRTREKLGNFGKINLVVQPATIKSRLSRYMTQNQTHRWVDVLPEVIESYNANYHRTIKIAPNQVKTSEEPYIWMSSYDHYAKNQNNK